MKKFMKPILALCIAVCGLIGLFSFTACESTPKDNTGDFVVYVLDENGKGVSGIWASWCVMDDPNGVCISAAEATDANGKAVLKEDLIVKKYPDKNFHVKLDGVPDGYTYQKGDDGYYNGDDYVISTENRTVTIKLMTAQSIAPIG